MAFAAAVAAVASGAVVQASAHAAPVARSTAAYNCGYYTGSVLAVYGDTGSRVFEVQCLLIRVGYRLQLDGIFGSGTLGAVKDFEAAWNGMTGAHPAVDGKVGSATWAALRSAAG
ncbi:peptidoglycan-binding domain-containing protein [Streptomyces sp. NPDC001455]|uniref:peptidoglycan-binding domain-containing protein n=1 Tax=Streptomyces sp. NPDC001455 TaxID=3154518 RepID=UPI003319B0DD